jgi:hypothetical protein
MSILKDTRSVKILTAFLCILAKFMVCIHHSHKQLVISAVVLFSHYDVQMLCFCTRLRSLKCAEKTKSPSLELLVFTHDTSRAHLGNRHFASNHRLGNKKVMTRQFLPSEVSRVECCGQSVVSLHRQQHRFNNRVKYSNTTDSPDQIGTIHVHFPSYRISTHITK